MSQSFLQGKKNQKTVELSFLFHPVLIFILKIRAAYLPPSPQAGIPLFFSGPLRVTALSAPRTATWLKEIFSTHKKHMVLGRKAEAEKRWTFELLVWCLFGAPAGTQQALMLKVT